MLGTKSNFERFVELPMLQLLSFMRYAKDETRRVSGERLVHLLLHHSPTDTPQQPRTPPAGQTHPDSL